MSVRFLLAVAVAVAVIGAAPAAAQEDAASTTSPAYPGNTITAAPTEDGPLVAATRITADLAGRTEWNDPDDDIPYAVSLYVQDAAVAPQCGGFYGAQRQQVINLPGLNATTGFSGFVLNEGVFGVGRTAPGVGTDWATTTAPFVIRPGVEQILLCAYTRYIVDDVSGFGVRYDVEQPACRTPRAVRRGRPLALDCNYSGRVGVRFTRGSRRVDRTVSLREAGERGRGRVSTRGLARGVHRVQVRTGGVPLGAPTRVRVR